jgi:hypothetical protein
VTISAEPERLLLEQRRDGSREVSGDESGVSTLHAVEGFFQCDDERTCTVESVAQLERPASLEGGSRLI